MSENVARVGRRVRELREVRGWSQGELAAFLGRTQTAVSYWESGKRAPGLDDLLDLSRVFGCTIAELVPQAPARPLPTLLRAQAEAVDAKQLAGELESFAEEAENAPTPTVRFRILVGSARDTAEALLAAAGVVKPPIPVAELAEGCGVRVLPWEFESENVDGLVVQLPDGAVIGVNTEQHDNRRRFTIAHELGHYLLKHAETFHIDFGGELSPGAAGEHLNYNWRHERAANDFAANLLMPADFVRTAYTKTPDATVLARKFHVSAAAMGIRLTNLRLR